MTQQEERQEGKPTFPEHNIGVFMCALTGVAGALLAVLLSLRPSGGMTFYLSYLFVGALGGGFLGLAMWVAAVIARGK